MDSLVEKIKQLCKSRSITVSMLEDKLNIPNNTIYQWKKRIPKIERLKQVANFFNVTTDFLLGEDENKVNHEGKTYDLNDLADEAVFFDGRKMTKQDREVVKNILKAYFDNKE